MLRHVPLSHNARSMMRSRRRLRIRNANSKMKILTEISFGEWLKRRRKAVGLTQEQFAGQLNCSTITLHKIEAEERRPSAQVVERLAEIFNIPPNEQTSFLRFARGDWRSAPPDTQDDFPWHVSTKSPRSNLPATTTSLIGREQEIALVLFKQPSLSGRARLHFLRLPRLGAGLRPPPGLTEGLTPPRWETCRRPLPARRVGRSCLICDTRYAIRSLQFRRITGR